VLAWILQGAAAVVSTHGQDPRQHRREPKIEAKEQHKNRRYSRETIGMKIIRVENQAAFRSRSNPSSRR